MESFVFNLQLFGDTFGTLYVHAMNSRRAHEEWSRINSNPSFLGSDPKDQERALFKASAPARLFNRTADEYGWIRLSPSQWVREKTRLSFRDGQTGLFRDFVRSHRVGYHDRDRLYVRWYDKGKKTCQCLAEDVVDASSEKLFPVVVEELIRSYQPGSLSETRQTVQRTVVWANETDSIPMPPREDGWVKTLSQKVVNNTAGWQAGRPIVLKIGYALTVGRFHKWVTGGFEAWTPADGIAVFRRDCLAGQNLDVC